MTAPFATCTGKGYKAPITHRDISLLDFTREGHAGRVLRITFAEAAFAVLRAAIRAAAEFSPWLTDAVAAAVGGTTCACNSEDFFTGGCKCALGSTAAAAVATGPAAAAAGPAAGPAEAADAKRRTGRPINDDPDAAWQGMCELVDERVRPLLEADPAIGEVVLGSEGRCSFTLTACPFCSRPVTYGVTRIHNDDGSSYRTSQWMTDLTLSDHTFSDHALNCTHNMGDVHPRIRPLIERISASTAPEGFVNCINPPTIAPELPPVQLRVPLGKRLDGAGVLTGGLAASSCVRDAQGSIWWKPLLRFHGITVDGKGLSKGLHGGGFGRCTGDVPTDHLPGTLGNVTDDICAPVFARPMARNIERIERLMRMAKSEKVLKERKYMNIGVGARSAVGLKRPLRALAFRWCSWHREHTSECKSEIMQIAATLLVGSDGARCSDAGCACCQQEKTWGGKAALTKWSKELRSRFSMTVKFMLSNRKDGTTCIQTGWPNRGLVDEIMLYSESEEVFPMEIFRCKTVRATIMPVDLPARAKPPALALASCSPPHPPAYCPAPASCLLP